MKKVQKRVAALAAKGHCWLVLLRDPRDVAISECYHRRAEQCRPDEFARERIEALSQWVALRKRLYDVIAEVSGWLGSILLRLPVASYCFLLLLASPARV